MATIKTAEHSTSAPSTNERDSRPLGTARRAVRGFFASIAASSSRFAAIATVRAATMQTTPEPVTYPMPEKRWTPERVPSPGELVARTMVRTAQRPLRLAGWQRRVPLPRRLDVQSCWW